MVVFSQILPTAIMEEAGGYQVVRRNLVRELRYDLPQQVAIRWYNGNISEQSRKQNGQLTKYFKHNYDKLNRLLEGNGPNDGMYELLTYDEIGNIQKFNEMMFL